MKRQEQRQLVRDAARLLTDQVLAAIAAGKVPSDWDGHELRTLMADMAAAEAADWAIRKHPHSRRAREYRNTKAIACL